MGVKLLHPNLFEEKWMTYFSYSTKRVKYLNIHEYIFYMPEGFEDGSA
jgi:hypothetical protein